MVCEVSWSIEVLDISGAIVVNNRGNVVLGLNGVIVYGVMSMVIEVNWAIEVLGIVVSLNNFWIVLIFIVNVICLVLQIVINGFS